MLDRYFRERNILSNANKQRGFGEKVMEDILKNNRAIKEDNKDVTIQTKNTNKLFVGGGFSFLRKRHLTPKQFEILFDIVSSNMQKIGFQISNDDKLIWIKGLKRHLSDEGFFLYLIYKNGKICGFIELTKSENRLIISEIQFCPAVQHSRLIIYAIMFMLNNKQLITYDVAYFSINKNNNMSKKTFAHLGGEVIDSKEVTLQYKIERNRVQRYVDKLLKNKKLD